MQIFDFGICKSPPTHTHTHHSRSSFMFYGWWDTDGCSSFTNSSLHVNPRIWPKDFELWFVRPKDFIPMVYFPVFVLLVSLEDFDIVLLPQNCFLTAILPCMPASLTLLLTVGAKTFFRDICSLVRWCLEQFCPESWWLTKFSAVLVAFGLLLTLFCTVSWYPRTV